MRRRNNQDSYKLDPAIDEAQWSKGGHLLIVADGMGAHAAGELASKLAVDQISHHYRKLSQSKPQHLSNAEILQQAFVEANGEIYRRGQANPEFRSMGTTACALIFGEQGVSLAHVGDSRIYRLRDGVMEQLTFDHSLVWEMRATGDISEEMLNNSTIPKNVITRSLGPNPHVEIDIEGPFDIRRGDRFLMCSDGLSGQLSDSELGTLLQLLDIQSAVQTMIDLANLRGGPDNITVVIAEILSDSIDGKAIANITPDRTRTAAPPFPVMFGVGAITGVILAVLLLALGQIPIALIALALSAATLGAGLHQRSSQQGSPPTARGSRGTSPYVRVRIKPDGVFAENLGTVVSELDAWFIENRWSLGSNGISQAKEQANRAERAGNHKEAIIGYSKIILRMMAEAQNLQNRPAQEDSGVIEL